MRNCVKEKKARARAHTHIHTVADTGFGNGGCHFRKRLIFEKHIPTETVNFS